MQKPTLPTGTTDTDFDFEELIPLFDGAEIYLGEGSYDDEAAMDAIVVDLDALDDEIVANYMDLGELAEEGIGYSSKQVTLPTHNRSVPGKRTTPLTIKLAGISNKVRAYLESSTFNGSDMTILLRSAQPNMVLIFNGMRWTYSHEGKTGAVNIGTLESSFNGSTVGKIFFCKEVPAAGPEA